MNLIINKLDLPCDMKRVIYEFIYYDNGFSYEQVDTIEKVKTKALQTQQQRIKLELMEWYRVDKGTIRWLRNGGVYNKVKGLDGPRGYETAVFREAYYAGLLPNTTLQPETCEVRKAQGTVRKYQGCIYKYMADMRLEEIRIYGHTL